MTKAWLSFYKNNKQTKIRSQTDRLENKNKTFYGSYLIIQFLTLKHIAELMSTKMSYLVM